MPTMNDAPETKHAKNMRRMLWAQPVYSDCHNCGRADHADSGADASGAIYACPCGCHDSAADTLSREVRNSRKAVQS